MAAYVVVTKLRTHNAAELKLYAEQSPNFLAGHEIKWHARFGHCDVLEGPGVESVGILEFPSLAEAKAWYTSPVYQEASQHRFRGGDYSFVLVEGVSAGRDSVWPTNSVQRALPSTMTNSAETMRSKSNVEHYTWGHGCDGWLLMPRADLSVIHEKMPAGSSERRHHHSRARQFFFVLSGTLTMELEGVIHQLYAHEGLEIEPMAKHQARNDSADAVEFLVISHPTTRGDRVDAELLD